VDVFLKFQTSNGNAIQAGHLTGLNFFEDSNKSEEKISAAEDRAFSI